MSNPKPTYEELENKIKNLELELNTIRNIESYTYKDFVQFSRSIYYKYSNLRGGLFWSDRVNILGFSPEEIKTDPFLWFNSIHPEDKPNVKKAIEDYAKGKNYEIEYRIQTKSGKWIWLQDHFIRKTQIEDEIIIDGNAIDVTYRKKAELELKESEERFKNYINSTSDIVFTLDTEQKHTGVFGDWVEKAGLTKSYFLGKTTKEILGENAEIHVKANEKALNGEQVVYEWSSVLGGNTLYFQTSLSPLFEGNTISGIIGVGRNITDLKNTEIALRKSENNVQKQNLELRKLNADKNRFISILAHDLKNPFSSILGILDLLTENIRTYNIEETEKLIHLLNISANKYYNLLNEILEWTKTKSGNFTFEPENLDFEIICQEVIDNLRLMANAKELSINISIVNDKIIIADKNMLTTILRNLISNSIKFTNRGGQINICLEKNENYFTVTISDNGVGITAKRLETLFEISHMSSTLGTEAEKGTGLGLLLCLELIEKHKGRIWAESEEGKGSVFAFTIPLFNK